MRSQLNYWLSTMNCNADEEERRNREISRNIDRQIKIEKSKRENVRLALNTVSNTDIISVIVSGASL